MAELEPRSYSLFEERQMPSAADVTGSVPGAQTGPARFEAGRAI